MDEIIQLAQKAAAMLPALEINPTRRNCVQLASVYGVLERIIAAAKKEAEHGE